MRLQERPASSVFPKIAAMTRSFLAPFLPFALVLSLGFDVSAAAATPAAAKDKKSKQAPSLKGLPISELSPDEAILHALNRLAYGPRPGDVERVRQMGMAKWIEEQLNPGSIDDKATRLNSSHGYISYAVFCLKKKKIQVIGQFNIRS